MDVYMLRTSFEGESTVLFWRKVKWHCGIVKIGVDDVGMRVKLLNPIEFSTKHFVMFLSEFV